MKQHASAVGPSRRSPLPIPPGLPAVLAAVALLAFAPAARAQWPQSAGPECALPAGLPGTSAGPDVVVGALFDARLWGVEQGRAAFSVGTTACNAGDQPVAWVREDDAHPVIAQNLYRLRGGRLEQIGLAWLKHGFAASAEDACGLGCEDPGTNQLLGIGCSDPYDGGLNGLQGTMGPRSELDPSTGGFPFPYSTRGQTGDPLYKRLQAAVADVDPAQNPGARWFAEAYYYAADDAAAGNGGNNVSYREIAFDGALQPSLVGPTHAGRAALEAWRAADPGVVIVDREVPGDGRFRIAARADALGGGSWRYEYAVHNATSHRGARSFTVPVAPGVDIDEIGFHDVDHHSGEPWDGTDWPAAVGAGGVTWQTDTEAADPDANALRFATTYNFWFEADRPPAPVAATLGLFRAGSPAAVTAVLPGPGQSAGLALQGGRFEVAAAFRTPQGETGIGHPVPLTDDSGYFWFFAAGNVELVVKVLDGCGTNDRYWVFAAGLTNVEVEITVTDTGADETETYLNPLGTSFQPILDTAAFDTCP